MNDSCDILGYFFLILQQIKLWFAEFAQSVLKVCILYDMKFQIALSHFNSRSNFIVVK